LNIKFGFQIIFAINDGKFRIKKKKKSINVHQNVNGVKRSDPLLTLLVFQLRTAY